MDDSPDPLVREAGDTISWACGRYDAGFEEMALQIAVAAKPLFEGNKKGEAFLAPHDGCSPVGLRSTTSLPPRAKANILGFLMIAPNKAGFHPELHRAERKEDIPWKVWWEKEHVLRLTRPPKVEIIRRQLVLAATGDFSNLQAMSADDYQFLVEGMNTKIQAGPKGGPMRWITLKSAHLAALRQIGYEILTSPDFQRIAGVNVATSKQPHKPTPPKLAIEEEMNRFVRSFGGQVVRDIVGPSPDFYNADYIFPQDSVVAELKCLEDDKSKDEHLQEKLQKIFDRYMDSGLIPDPGPGKHLVQSIDMPVPLQRDIYKLFARPIKRRLDEANTQIKQTRERLNMPNAHGLVLLANDGNFGLEPAQWIHAVRVALGNNFSAIDTVIMFTANMLSLTPKLGQHAQVWMPASRFGHPEISENFLRRFGDGWVKHVSVVHGVEVPVTHNVEMKDLEMLKYDRKVSESAAPPKPRPTPS